MKYNVYIHYEHSKSEQTTDQHRYHIAVHSQRKGKVKVEMVKGKRIRAVTAPENIMLFQYF